MKKKKEVKDVEKVTAEMTTEEAFPGYAVVKTEEKKPLILPVTVDFGREDLNNIGKKLNEVIEWINKR